MLSYQNLFISLLLFFCCYATYTDLRERKIKNLLQLRAHLRWHSQSSYRCFVREQWPPKQYLYGCWRLFDSNRALLVWYFRRRRCETRLGCVLADASGSIF